MMEVCCSWGFWVGLYTKLPGMHRDSSSCEQSNGNDFVVVVTSSNVVCEIFTFHPISFLVIKKKEAKRATRSCGEEVATMHFLSAAATLASSVAVSNEKAAGSASSAAPMLAATQPRCAEDTHSSVKSAWATSGASTASETAAATMAWCAKSGVGAGGGRRFINEIGWYFSARSAIQRAVVQHPKFHWFPKMSLVRKFN